MSFIYHNGIPRKPTHWYKKILTNIRGKWSSLKYFPTQVKYFFINVCNYFPILWNDREWLDYYLLDILKIKFEGLARVDKKHYPPGSRRVKYILLLLDRIVKHEYSKEELRAHREKWGDLIVDFIDIPKEEYGMECSEMKCYTKKSKELGLEDQEREEILAIYRRGEAARQKDLDRLYKHLRKYHDAFWI